MARGRIRVESDEHVVTNAKILYLPEDDGPPIDISRAVQGVDVHLHVGSVATASLHVLMVEGHLEAEVEDVITKRLRPYTRFRRTRRAWRWFTDKIKARIVRSLRREAQRQFALGRWPR